MDKRARKILLDAYWGSSGWKNGDLSEEEHNYAISKGVMFKPTSLSHEETLMKIRKLCNTIKLHQVTSAFLYSLSTRELEYRSALGSYIYGSSIPLHQSTDKDYCYICGYREVDNHKYNRTLDVYNFERIKWGGVRHDYSSYAMFDLIEFEKLPEVEPTSNDIRIFKKIIEIANSIETGGPRELEKAISHEFSSNKAEREMLLGILGICSILQTPDNQGYLNAFDDLYHRDPPPKGRANDWSYPVSWWRVENGVNEEALHQVFGEYL